MAFTRRAKDVPMSPVPSTVMRLPQTERMGGFSLLQSWRCIHSCTVGICRSSISVTMTMCSLMVTP